MRLVGTVLAMMVLAVQGAAAAADAPPRAINAQMMQRIDTGLTALTGTSEGQTPALEVAVVQQGRIVYDRALGTAHAGARFRIASVTKMVTAVAVMQLVQAGRIALDAHVATYLPIAPHASDITVRQLLNHTSGLWNYGDDVFSSGAFAEPTTPEGILDYARPHPLTAPPGTKYAYSNTGYVVLGLIVEHVSGERLADYDRAHIFAPAGMRETSAAATEPTLVPGMMSATGGALPAFDPSWFYACGDLISTAADLARFDIALLNGTLVSPATLALMQQSPVATNEPRLQNAKQGLGLMMISAYGIDFVGHHGGLPGYEAENELIPRDRSAIIVLSDAFDFATARANNVVLHAMLPHVPLAAPPVASASVPEDPAITARFQTALTGLMNGTADRASFDAASAAALTPEALTAVAAQLKPFGTITTVKYVSTQRVQGVTVYRYRVTYSSGQTYPWVFAIDGHDKITSLSVG